MSGMDMVRLVPEQERVVAAALRMPVVNLTPETGAGKALLGLHILLRHRAKHGPQGVAWTSVPEVENMIKMTWEMRRLGIEPFQLRTPADLKRLLLLDAAELDDLWILTCHSVLLERTRASAAFAAGSPLVGRVTHAFIDESHAYKNASAKKVRRIKKFFRLNFRPQLAAGVICKVVFASATPVKKSGGDVRTIYDICGIRRDFLACIKPRVVRPKQGSSAWYVVDDGWLDEADPAAVYWKRRVHATQRDVFPAAALEPVKRYHGVEI